MTTLDIFIVILSVSLAALPALMLAKRAGKGRDEFFVSGRSAPWWLIGTSMVATTFSTDTPNLVTDLVRTGGVSGNWAWWAFLVTGMVTVFFYAPLWRRAGFLTDLEFYELRYAGKAAAFLRGFRAVYLGVFFNILVMAAVTLAGVKMGSVMLGLSRESAVVACILMSILFGSPAGLSGVLVSDLIQFSMAMIGVTAAAFFAVTRPEVGGLRNLIDTTDPQTLSLLPSFSNGDAVMTLLIVPFLIQWWSTWYPGAEPGGGSYVAQRMLAARSPKDALRGTLWFNIAHYALRPWPWILVALASIKVFPTLDSLRAALPHVDPALIGHDLAYPAMLLGLPSGVRGLVVAALLAAYLSTMSTHMNWGASYLVNDVYVRFINRDAKEQHLVLLGRVSSALIAIAAGAFMLTLGTASEAFNLLVSVGAGTGAIYLLRWFWWRVNPWTEIIGMAVSLFIALYFRFSASTAAYSSSLKLVITVAITTLAAVMATFVFPPSDDTTLRAFIDRTGVGGGLWAAARARLGITTPQKTDFGDSLKGAIAGCFLVYSLLFGVGEILYGRWLSAAVFGAAALIAAFSMRAVLRRFERVFES
ncbi:MAG: Na+:solute symporter [Vicinamibacteria bacterium]|nr:Na+:solute symporter [Vicinamibacteria bacterium]